MLQLHSGYCFVEREHILHRVCDGQGR
eukprot:COSAG02_NODE_75082_length_149_cov_247.800000_1_plen_26_part_10